MDQPCSSSSRENARPPAANRKYGPRSNWLGALMLATLFACGGSVKGGRSSDDAGADPQDSSLYPPGTCGDGVIDPNELCDDGNTEDDDGCSADCRALEWNYDCSDAGTVCPDTCGDGEFDENEECDDGNTEGGDGCSATCTVEEGFGCARPGSPCVELPVCGNGIRERGEACDSGSVSDPGCVECATQPGFWCATPGEPCLAEKCGDGVRTPNEACDDDNESDGDGCSSTCSIEEGFRCGSDGCRPICGDALIRGGETCDDGDMESGDGCSAGCRLEPGAACPTAGEACGDAECGNGELEGGEGCDDGNQVAGDGCGPTCQLEPQVNVGPTPVVQTRCGDGLVTSGEACDDGNTASGDGCSSTCGREPGFTCVETLEYPDSVRFRVTYRDFRGRSEAGGHPHMRTAGTSVPETSLDLGIVGAVCNASNAASCGRLDGEGKPQLAAGTHPTVNTGGSNHPDAFALWYRDENTGSLAGANGIIQVRPDPTPVPASGDFLTLTRVGQTDAYQFEDDTFFPLNDRGFGTTPGQEATDRNFHFTTELRYFFQYKGGETLTFHGDDDVWVFINGRLAVDIGGIHAQEWGRVVLGDDGDPSGGDSSCTVSGGSSEPDPCTQSPEEAADNVDSRFGLSKGNVYEIVLFHAERHPTGSNFRLTLAGFLAPRTYCTPDCGDGMVVGWETCDGGEQNADNVYGVCNTTCSGREYCGDGVLQAGHEACDNGFNVDLYASGLPDACAAGCVLPPSCGDGVVQAPFELCDEGEQNADDAYDGCTTQCSWGPYCGDGHVDPGEQCDDGLGPDGNVSYATEPGRCGYDCKPAFVLL